MIYVDEAKIPYRGMLMCHLYADSLAELHQFAQEKMQLRAWAFTRGTHLAHYNISLSQRAKAIHYGAMPIDRAWLQARIRLMLEKKNKNHAATT